MCTTDPRRWPMAERAAVEKRVTQVDKVDEKLIERAVRELREIVIGGGVELIVRVGEKKLLAEAAVDAGWSAEELRTKIPRLQKRHPGGRPKEPALRVFLARAARTIENVQVADLRKGLDAISPAERRHLRSQIGAL